MHRRANIRRFRPTRVAVATAALLLPLAATPQVTPSCTTFSATGGEQVFVVPDRVSSVTVTAFGAQGGDATSPAGSSNTPPGSGGRGSRASGVLAVTPGEMLYVYVGQRTGFNGGGLAGASDASIVAPGASGNGGGASDVRYGGNTLADRVLVAAGGGGGAAPPMGSCSSANATPGHGANADSGVPGLAGSSCWAGGSGGASASPTAGGNGGNPGMVNCEAPAGPGLAGTLGVGGLGGSGVQGCAGYSGTGGGGGGGGYYGGGGGAGGTGGGGGSWSGGGGGGGISFIGGVTDGAIAAGERAGDGEVTLCYSASAVAPEPRRCPEMRCGHCWPCRG